MPSLHVGSVKYPALDLDSASLLAILFRAERGTYPSHSDYGIYHERLIGNCLWNKPPYLADRIRSAHFSPTMMLGAFVLPEGMVGKIEASAMRNPSRPWTFKFSSTTAFVALELGPIRQEPIG